MSYKNSIVIIPARGGSKRFPNKNTALLGSIPLLVHSINYAKASNIDKIIVTTNDHAIKGIALKNGAEVIDRPEELSGDLASTVSALKHVLETIKDTFEKVILLQPTSPLRQTKHIDAAIELLDRKSADAVISVTQMEHSPLWNNTLPEDGSMQNFLSEKVKNIRSQDLEKYYRLNGAIYITKTDKLLEEKSFFLKENMFAYCMDRETSVDIDEEIDFLLSRQLLERKYL